ncbi:MAG: hypothetical protein IMY67_10565 [Bacteroidetes bacterium]|nr:hypothetical protein [Bacteroidota bacterium]
MKKLVFAIAVVLTVGFTLTSCKSEVKKEVEEATEEVVKEAEEVVEETIQEAEVAMATYQCPMKCEGEKTYDKPGQCPTCKMDLAEVKSEGEAEEQEQEEETEG